MRTLLNIAILVMVAHFVHAQNTEPSVMNFTHPTTFTQTKEQTRFFYGWNIVNSPRALTQRYHMNVFQGNLFMSRWYPLDSADKFTMLDMPDSSEIIYILDSLCRPSSGPLDATAIVWHPWLPTITDNTFTPYKNDKSGASIPFLYRNTSLGQVDSTTESGNQIYRWRFNSNPAVTTPVLAFNKPWLGNEYVYKPNSLYLSLNDNLNQQYDTRRCYVTVNLRRTLATDNDTTANDTILIIKVPYHLYNGTTGYMSFDSVPIATNNNSNWGRTRGLQRRLQYNNSTNLTEFVITRKMIPVGIAADRDVTISAFFWERIFG
ncbi:MAG: hypothetical protein K1X91_17445 [Bacteriodetes bacterium]|nr:hypothetical protein [Bacteroidota bacterium]